MFEKYVKNTQAVISASIGDKELSGKIEEAFNILNEAIQNGRKFLVAGNGGSAAEAQHFVAEIIGRYKRERRAYPALALSTDTSILTALGNDYTFDIVFSRQIEALGSIGDVFVGMSTSGNSKNIIEAVRMAKKKEMKTICLLGNGGGLLRNEPDVSVIVPSKETCHIQELHLMIIHFISERLEMSFQ